MVGLEIWEIPGPHVDRQVRFQCSIIAHHTAARTRLQHEGITRLGEAIDGTTLFCEVDWRRRFMAFRRVRETFQEVVPGRVLLKKDFNYEIVADARQSKLGHESPSPHRHLYPPRSVGREVSDEKYPLARHFDPLRGATLA